MASLPPSSSSPRHLMSLGMFVFGMDTLPYQSLQRSNDWRHGKTERFGTRDASQFIGPGAETISLSGLCVPELGGSYAAFQTIEDMAATGENYPLMDGDGLVLGHYYILRLDRDHLTIMGGGRPRHIGFRLELERAADIAPVDA